MRLAEIDIIKGIAIVSIIFQHVNLLVERPNYLVPFIQILTKQAVSLFFIIAGFTSALYIRKGITIKGYFKKRIIRFFKPLYPIFPIVLLLKYIIVDLNQLHFLPYWLVGSMRGFGAGSYFITAYLQWILIFPLFYCLLHKKSYLITSIILLFILFFGIHAIWYLYKDYWVGLISNLYFWGGVRCIRHRLRS